MRILIFAGDSSLRTSIAESLSSSGFCAFAAGDSVTALDEILSGIYDAAVISVFFDSEGLELLSRLRLEQSSLHVLLLTAPNGVARAAGYDAGADCCLDVPFENAELLSALRALLRRRSEVLAAILSFGDLSLNLSSCSLQCGDRKIRLNSTELELMRLLLTNGENLVSKENLLVKIWGYDSEVESGIVETYISFLRKKLRRLNSLVSIETLWRRGYRLIISGGRET